MAKQPRQRETRKLLPVQKNDLLRSVQRALSILDLIARSPGGLTIREVSRLLEMNLSTCYHSLNTLVAAGYLERRPSGFYVLGPQIPYLNEAYVQSLMHQAAEEEDFLAGASPVARCSPLARLRPVLHSLSERLQEPSYLAQWRFGEVELQAIIEPPRAEKIPGIYVGYRGQAHAHALGKVLLAYSSPASVEHYLKQHALLPSGPRTIVQPSHLIDELNRVLRQGYGVDCEELYAGIACLAAPIFDVHGRVSAALAISFDQHLLARRREWLIAEVQRAASYASAELRSWNRERR
jgi:DNA-binding IclR family transcriptional regulator